MKNQECYQEGNAKMYEALHDHIWSGLGVTQVLYHETWGRYQGILKHMRMAAIRGESICGSTYKAMLQEQELVNKYGKKLQKYRDDFDQLASIAAMVASHHNIEFVLTIRPDSTWSFGPMDGGEE